MLLSGFLFINSLSEIFTIFSPSFRSLLVIKNNFLNNSVCSIFLHVTVYLVRENYNTLKENFNFDLELIYT